MVSGLMVSDLQLAAGYRASGLVHCRVGPGNFTPSLSQIRT